MHYNVKKHAVRTQLFWQDDDTHGMTVIFPLTSLTAIQSWITTGNTVSATPPAESMRLFVDAAWMAGVPNSGKFAAQAERLLDGLERRKREDKTGLPKNILHYLQKLSADDLERMKKILALDTSLHENPIGEPIHGYQLVADSDRFPTTNNPLQNLTQEEWQELESKGKLIQRSERNGVTREICLTRIEGHLIFAEMKFLMPVDPMDESLKQLQRLTHPESLQTASQNETYQSDLRRAIALAEQIAKEARSRGDLVTEQSALEYEAEALGKLGRWRERIRVRWRQVIGTRHSPPIVHIEKLMALGSDYLAVEAFENAAFAFRRAAKITIDNHSPLARDQRRLVEVLEMEVIAWRMAGKETPPP